jgi:CubicO group peptidase (beta-lactamase class C family)
MATTRPTDHRDGAGLGPAPRTGSPAGPRPRAADADLRVDLDRLQRADRLLDRWVEEGRLPGWSLLVAHRGTVVHRTWGGWRDVAAGLPVAEDTVFRIYSMTKPITSVAALTLFEEGAFDLTDPVATFLPAFAQPVVYRGGPAHAPVTVPATEPIRLWHLLTHTAGLTYGFHDQHPVETLYQRAGFGFGWPTDTDLAGCCDRLAALPLLFEPGSSWTYSVATDVLGRVLEVVTGQTLDQVLHERVLEPLGMAETGFAPPAGRHDDVAVVHSRGPDGRLVPVPGLVSAPVDPPPVLSGGGGLFSTVADYHRFTQMLLGAGTFGDRRMLAPATMALMAANHLPGGADLEHTGRRLYAEVPFEGTGFGLGVSVLLDPVAAKSLSAPGELAWGGAASTTFWVDPARRLEVILMTHLMPSNSLPLRTRLRTVVNQALVD